MKQDLTGIAGAEEDGVRFGRRWTFGGFRSQWEACREFSRACAGRALSVRAGRLAVGLCVCWLGVAGCVGADGRVRMSGSGLVSSRGIEAGQFRLDWEPPRTAGDLIVLGMKVVGTGAVLAGGVGALVVLGHRRGRNGRKA